jgi:hypothetical protein
VSAAGAALTEGFTTVAPGARRVEPPQAVMARSTAIPTARRRALWARVQQADDVTLAAVLGRLGRGSSWRKGDTRFAADASPALNRQPIPRAAGVRLRGCADELVKLAHRAPLEPGHGHLRGADLRCGFCLGELVDEAE